MYKSLRNFRTEYPGVINLVSKYAQDNNEEVIKLHVDTFLCREPIAKNVEGGGESD